MIITIRLYLSMEIFQLAQVSGDWQRDQLCSEHMFFLTRNRPPRQLAIYGFGVNVVYGW
jgi:hypothetical protein